MTTRIIDINTKVISKPYDPVERAKEVEEQKAFYKMVTEDRKWSE